MTIITVTPHPAAGVGVTRAGPRGKGWIFVEGVPTDDKGADGEMYLDTTTFIVYGPKAGGTWVGAAQTDLLAPANLAEAAKVAAEAAAAAAEADRLQTEADRLQTTADRLAAAASAATASTKAAQASDDADATAADRVQTGLDRTATENAAANAAASALGASGSADAANASALNAATSELNAANSAIAADASADAAAADAVQTAADRVQTGLDRAAAEQAKLDAEAAAGSMTPVNDQIVAATEKTTPVNADLFGIVDNAASNALKKLTWANLVSAVTTALGSVFQAANSKLTTLAGQTWAADRFTYYTSASAAAIGTITSFGRSLIDDADATAARTTLGLGGAATLGVGTTAGTVAAGNDSRITGAAQKASNLSDLASAATAFSNIKQAATTTATGVVELATDAEMTGGTAVGVIPDVKQVADYVAAYVAANAGGSNVIVQTGYVQSNVLSTSTAEDLRYIDVAISPVSDMTKCLVTFEGGSGAGVAPALSEYITSTNKIKKCTARLTSTSNLRLASPGFETGETWIAGRWQVVEFA